MEIYKGINALSEFRQAILLKQLQASQPNIQEVSAEFVHFVYTNRTSAIGEDVRLQKLLTYDTPYINNRTENMIIVGPRPGTISPWSSKATDIALNCGLKHVNRIERVKAFYIVSKIPINKVKIQNLLYDRMTETIFNNLEETNVLFETHEPKSLKIIDIKKHGIEALEKINTELGLALSGTEIKYLYQEYSNLNRNPNDAEIMMFASVNSEHCRHKVFNSSWTINGKKQPKSLFEMISNTYEKSSQDVLSAYSDNAAVIRGPVTARFFPDPNTGSYNYSKEPIHSVIKVETHNHPTAVAPFSGAATGSGGEIRDEGATGRGGKPKMGLAGYTVSNLQLSEMPQPWEEDYGKPDRISSPLEIMIEAPIGAAAYNNEFGRPNLGGYFRTYEQKVNGIVRGYHKPIMIAGGLGNIRDKHIDKLPLPVGAQLIIIGGPAMLIGLGGGAASSMQSGQSESDLDFASVQRANAEMQRRVQEVIDHCWAMGENNPIISIHDIGAGGLCNGLPELINDSGLGGNIELRDIPNAEPGMSPKEIWCNEAQERYVLGIDPKDLEIFKSICERENCLYAVVGKTVKKRQLTVTDKILGRNVIDLPMTVLFGKPPKMERSFTSQKTKLSDFDITNIKIDDAVKRVLQIPSVGSKQFLITIGDRNVGGLLTRDQMIGPWQVPVSDVAVAASGFDTEKGEAMTMGERTPLAVIDSSASARMAVGESITNITAANIEKISDIKLSANWMSAIGADTEEQALYEAVHALGEEFCPAIGLTIPVGKDSLSMRTVWNEKGQSKSVTSPMSVIISSFAPVININKTLTPLFSPGNTSLLLIDLGQGKNRLSGSALAQAYSQTGNTPPDADPQLLKLFFTAIQKLNNENKILAYHDRSDGGLITTLCEMAFASRSGLKIDLSSASNALGQLFNEELGAVIQIKSSEAIKITDQLNSLMPNTTSIIGQPQKNQIITVNYADKIIYKNTRATLQSLWSETSYRIQSLRDNKSCAVQEFESIQDDNDPGISPKVIKIPEMQKPSNEIRPKVAIFRVQGVNGQVEMAAAFDKAGFESIDVTLTDITSKKLDLKDFTGLVACGGFSYGDVLGAGEGWAKSILFNPQLTKQFKEFFERNNTFSLGVCNGCQMLSALKELIPGANSWPRFLKNNSEQFEARLSQVKILSSPSIFFKGMDGSILPVPVAHGEGRAENAISPELVAGIFVDNNGKQADRYPENPNGSPGGITVLTTPNGRSTIMMPHPERAFLTQQLSWHPTDWQKDSPWFQMFQNVREWVEETKA